MSHKDLESLVTEPEINEKISKDTVVMRKENWEVHLFKGEVIYLELPIWMPEIEFELGDVRIDNNFDRSRFCSMIDDLGIEWKEDPVATP